MGCYKLPRNTLCDQCVPGKNILQPLLDGDVHLRGGIALKLLFGDITRGRHDALMGDPHRGRRLRHPIQIHEGAAAIGPIGATHRRRRIQRQPPVLFQKGKKRCLTQTRDKNRFILIE